MLEIGDTTAMVDIPDRAAKIRRSIAYADSAIPLFLVGHPTLPDPELLSDIILASNLTSYTSYKRK